MRTFFAVLLASAFLIGLPAAADASSYVVTATASTPTPEANHSFTITGSVSPNAHGQPVTLYRRYATSSSYSKLATATIHSSGNYSFSTKTGHPGKIYYKISKSSAGSHSAGSKTIAVTVYRWRNLTDLSGTTIGIASETPMSSIMGWDFPHSVETGNNGKYIYTLGGRCTRFTATVGFNQGASSSGLNSAAYVEIGDPVTAYILGTTVYKDGFGQFATDTTKIVGADKIVLHSVEGPSTTSIRVVFGNPQVYCAS